MIKKLITGAIAAAITATSVLAGGFSTTPPSSKNSAHTQSNDVNNDYDLRATNSLGKYITQASRENNINPDLKLMSDSKKDSFNVTNLTFDAESGLIHAVSSQTTECTIVFSFIDEETNDIVQEVKKTVEAGEYISTEAKADTAILPQYFIVKAQLVDKKGKTVSNVFTLNAYTKIMQEIAATDIHDFDEAQVINFDESEETNFIVLSDDTVKAESSEDENTLVSADFDSNTFVFENIDETIQYLQNGDLLYVQPDEENIIAVEVDDISIDGDTATIKGNENVDDIFDFIKIETQMNDRLIEADTSDSNDKIIFPEHNENNFSYPSDQPLSFKLDRKKALKINYNSDLSIRFPGDDIFDDKFFGIDGPELYGTLFFKASFNFYKKSDYKSAGLSLTSGITATFKMVEGEMNSNLKEFDRYKYTYDENRTPILDKNGNQARKKRVFDRFSDKACEVYGDAIGSEISETFELGGFKIPLGIPGVYLDIRPAIVLSASGSIEINVTLSYTVGFTYDSSADNKFQSISNEDNDYNGCKLNICGEVFLGLQLKPELVLIYDKLLSVSLEITAGFVTSVELEVDMTDVADALEQQKSEDGRVVITDKTDDFYHPCPLCFYGTVALRLRFGITATIVGKEFTVPFEATLDTPLPFDWCEYCFGLKSLSPLKWHNDLRVAYADNPKEKVCPLRKYKVEFKATDEKTGYGIQDVEVTLGGLTQHTDYKGSAIFYCDNGNYSYTMSFGDKTKTGSFTVNNAKHVENGEFTCTLDDDGTIKIDSIKTKSSEGEKSSVITTTARVTKPVVTQTVCKAEDQIMESLQLGDNIWGYVYPDNTLYIYGDGAMFDDKSLSFKNAANIETVVFDETDPKNGKRITSIGNYLFNGCVNLKSISYVGSPNEGKVAVDIPPSITKIGDNAFENCRSLPFGDYKLHDGIKSVGSYAFKECHGMTSCTIPNSVESMGGSIFNCCLNLEKVTLPFAGPTIDTSTYPLLSLLFGYFYFDGGPKSREYKEYADKFNTITYKPKGRDWETANLYVSIEYPSYIPVNFKEVEITGGYQIPENGFSYCSFLEKITLPDTIESVGKYAFYDCNKVKELNLTDNLTTIGYGAFRQCSSLEKIILSENITTIGYSAFVQTGEAKVYIPEKIDNIPDDAFNTSAPNTIYGYKGSFAEKYANNKKIKFVAYGSDDFSIERTTTTTTTTTTVTTTTTTTVPTPAKTTTTSSGTPAEGVRGDANGDGELDMSDAVLIMQALANPNKYGTSGTSPTHITAAGFKYADNQKAPTNKVDTHIKVLSHSISDIQSEVLWRFY